MADHAPQSGGCPKLTPLPQNPHHVAFEYGLAQCTKYNITTPRGIPEKGEEICERPGSSPTNCWMDLRACRKAEIPRRAYERSFVGQHDPQGEPQVVLAETDSFGREYYCLQRNGQWIHDGDHDFPVGMR